MTQPGRRSIEARSVVNVSGPRERLKPPPELTGTRREIFLDLISGVPPEHFRRLPPPRTAFPNRFVSLGLM